MNKLSILFGNMIHCYVSTGPNHKLTIRFDTFNINGCTVFNMKVAEMFITKTECHSIDIADKVKVSFMSGGRNRYFCYLQMTANIIKYINMNK